MKKGIWISDLTHTAQGIGANGFPLGASYIYAYAKKIFGNEFDFKLFKLPVHLEENLRSTSPAIISFSNYSWNLELGYKFAFLAKQRDPKVVTVFGGPNFPTDENEKLDFLKKKPAIDFYIELEGELGFVDLVKVLTENNFNVKQLKKLRKKIINTCYIYDDKLITGSIERIKDINIIPSPYLTGALDQCFQLPLIPMLETTRGCPFTCTFCADGLGIKSKINRYESQRTREELLLIAKNINKVDELIVTDLNFGMYKQDMETAKEIANIQKNYNYPISVDAPAGKNMPKRIINIASIMKGWSMGGVIQSSDPDVLKAIKRSNISISAYQDLIDFGNKQKTNRTYTEIILGLPSDTKEKHFESLRLGVEKSVNNLRMHQAMLLTGTEMASKRDREKYGLVTKFRTLPGNVGNYNILNEEHPVAEIEEIVVGSNTLSMNDYVECRIMNLIIKTFYNNNIFNEIHSMQRAMGISPFDCLVYIKDHEEMYTEKVKKIIESFVTETTEDLFETREKANEYVMSPNVINKYINGELGTNELFLHSSLLFNEFKDISDLIFESVKRVIKHKGLLTPLIENYLTDLKKFTLMRKNISLNNENIPLNNTESVLLGEFKYDFESIHKSEYFLNPNSISKLKIPIQLKFFHTNKQQEHITNQQKLYSSHALGLGRMLQQTNLNLVFRSFKRNQ